MPEWRCWVLYQAKKARQWARASSMQPKRAGKSGRYFIVLNCDSENGLSSETWGLLWLLATSQSTRHAATGLERMLAIGVQRERAGLDVMPIRGVVDELLGQFGALALGKQPAHDMAAEDVQDVQVEARPFGRTLELWYVPGPHLVGRECQQLRFCVRRMDELIAPLATAAVDRQQSVHRANRSQITALIEQRGVHRRRCRVDEALAVESVQQHLALLRVQGQWRAGPRSTLCPRSHQRCAVQQRLMARRCAPPQSHGPARGASSKGRGELLHGRHHVLSPFSSI